MKIKIIKNEEKYNDQILVSFTSEFGSGKARWNGKNPIEGEEYFVELEIPDTVEWRKDVTKSVKDKYCIKSDGNVTMIVCEVETLFEYGCCDFRIGSSIVTLDIEGEPYPRGTFVKISSQNLILYNINL
ncbi:hypothetical protein [Priestia koreensis]|uniref:hypothetical protein n=1 Tax=Priestia koreensis TaxID=284581 RepID=UPI0034594239